MQTCLSAVTCNVLDPTSETFTSLSLHEGDFEVLSKNILATMNGDEGVCLCSLS